MNATQEYQYKECPRCHKDTLNTKEVLNALSRRDNDTYICSACGTEEAMLDAGLATYLEDEKLALENDLAFQKALGIK